MWTKTIVPEETSILLQLFSVNSQNNWAKNKLLKVNRIIMFCLRNKICAYHAYTGLDNALKKKLGREYVTICDMN